MGQMLERSRTELGEANRRLASLNHALEARVEERTHKLQQANLELNHEREEQGRLIEELKATQTQLIQSEKMASVGVLATGVAHEINNPLTFVSTNVSILDNYAPLLKHLCQQAVEQSIESESAFSDEVERRRQYAEIADSIVDLLDDSVEGVRRIRIITESLLEFSHSGDTSWQDCNINKCVESTIVICRHEYKNKALVETDLASDLPLVNAVPAQLNQVIMALVINAAQAISNEGIIRIRTHQEGDNVLVSVCDNGCGIEPEYVSRIFEPFFTTKAVGEGTGLGLSVAYGIIQAHNGRMEVKSTPGKGSCFHVVLPLYSPHSKS
jgi:C4-dicarboxylate-specific signal transduction histidine kinase